MSSVPVQIPLFGETKPCGSCQRTLPVEAFHRRTDRVRGWLSHCKECAAARERARALARKPPPAPVPPPATERHCTCCGLLKPTAEFPLKQGRPTSHCKECKRKAKLVYNETHRKERSEYQRRYYGQNKAVIKDRISRSIAAKPDKYRRIHSDWKKQNRDACRASGQRRYAREKHNGGSWAAFDWQRLKAQCDWRCLMCGKQEITDGITLCFDHIVPLSRGGFNIISNGQPLCRSCNSLKHRKVLDLRPNPYSF